MTKSPPAHRKGTKEKSPKKIKGGVIIELKNKTEPNAPTPEQRIKTLEKRFKLCSTVFAVLLCAAFVAIWCFRCTCDKSTESLVQKGEIVMTQPVSDRDLQAEVNKAMELGLFNVFMNTDVVFEDAEALGNVLIQNSENNQYPVYVEIVRNDTGETILTSDVIPEGYKLENARLSCPVEKGQHECTALFNILNGETDAVLNTISLNITVTIEN